MTKFSKDESERLVSYANNFGLAGAIVGLLLGLVLLSMGGSNILGVMVLTGLGYVIGFVKAAADGADIIMKSKLIDPKR